MLIFNLNAPNSKADICQLLNSLIYGVGDFFSKDEFGCNRTVNLLPPNFLVYVFCWYWVPN